MSEAQVDIPSVIVDSREPESLYLAIAKACEGQIVVREAASTDIIIPGTPGFALERKEIGDFIGTWQNNRLYEQLATLKNFQDAGYQVALLLVGNMTKELRYRKLKPIQLINMIVSVWAGWGITILPVEQDWAVPYVVKYLAGKAAGEKHDYKIAKAAPRDATPAEQATYVLQSFPGIGTAVSEKVKASNLTLIDFLDGIAGPDDPGMKEPAELGLTEKQRDKLFGVLMADWKEPKEELK